MGSNSSSTDNFIDSTLDARISATGVNNTVITSLQVKPISFKRYSFVTSHVNKPASNMATPGVR